MCDLSGVQVHGTASTGERGSAVRAMFVAVRDSSRRFNRGPVSLLEDRREVERKEASAEAFRLEGDQAMSTPAGSDSGQQRCPVCGTKGFHTRQGEVWRCGIKRCRRTFRVIDGLAVEFEIPAPPRKKQSRDPEPVPRDRRFIPRRRKGGKLAQTRIEHAFKCSGCQSTDIRRLDDGSGYYRCGVCHEILLMDRNHQMRRLPRRGRS